MLLAFKGKEIPNEWKHDKLLTDKYGESIAVYYAKSGINIPPEWIYDELFII